MRGKKIFKRIAASILMLTIICSNIPVLAGSLPDDIPIVTEAAPASQEADGGAAVSDSEDAAERETPSETEAEEPSSDEITEPADDPEGTDSELPPAEEVPDTEVLPEQPTEDPVLELPPEQPEEDPALELPSEQPTEDPVLEQPAEDSGPELPAKQPEEASGETQTGYEEEEPLDFDNQISIEDLSGLPDGEVGSTIYLARRARPMLSALYNVAGDQQTGTKAWTYDAYYVNQQDPYDVTKTSDFDLKYQMEFHASQDLAAGSVLIRIDAAVYEDRNGNVVLPTEIAVPQGDLENPVSSRTTPFNYYLQEEEGKTYLVFFNYKKIPSGTNAAWQVLYKNQKLMNIVDETPWTLTPQISVDTGAKAPSEDDPEGKPARPYSEAEFESRTALTGRIDSSVTLTSVTKAAYNEPGRNYAPGLYTRSQVEKYINGSVPDQYLNEDGRLNTQDWRYVVWDVKIQGKATQPWRMSALDSPSVSGSEDRKEMYVVGYRDHSDSATTYNYAVNAPDAAAVDCSEEVDFYSTDQTKSSWGNRFYVVAAYPAARVSSGTVVQNEIQITLTPCDGKDEEEVKISTPASWTYADYDWHFTGEKIGIRKKNGIGLEEDDIEYTGWLDAYRRSSESGDDYGEIPYSTTSVMHGYSDTHRIESGVDENGNGYTLGDYIPGTYYTFTTADDFLYLYTDHDDSEEQTASVLTGDDYYFSDITVTQKDSGYDVWEDERTDSELWSVRSDELPKGIFEDSQSQVRIYAMLADPAPDLEHETDAQGWELVYTGYMNPGGQFSVSLGEAVPEIMAQHPCRIKVEHDSIDYESICQIDVNVRLKAVEKDTAAAQVMKDILEAHEGSSRKDVKSPVVQLENISGAMCQAYKTDSRGEIVPAEFYSFDEEDIKEGNYEEPGLADLTMGIYPGVTEKNLPVRGSAIRNLTWLSEIAEANKESKSTNDVNNNRVLVDYYLTAYDGYEIYDRNCLDYLKEEDQTLISPGRSHVVFYDLLPYGMQYDASTEPVAGRITELDKKEKYKTTPGNWSKTQVQVVVDPSRDIIPDYRGTGRTMVAFHVIYTGADATAYTDQKWIEGWGVSFRAYYDWKDISQINNVDINSNLCAFMPDFSEIAGGSNDSHPALCGLRSEVDYDDGTHGDKEERPGVEAAYEDMVRPYIDENGAKVSGNIDGISRIEAEDGEIIEIDRTFRNVIYAKNTLKDNVATSSTSRIETLVHADADTLGAFGSIATVPVSENPPEGSLMNRYTYDNTVTVGSDTTNIVIFNRLEMAAQDRGTTEADPFFPFAENPWSGTFRGVDTSGLEKQGIASRVYYSADPDARITAEGENPSDILTSEHQWYTQDDFIRMLTDQGKTDAQDHWQQYVKAVAVDLGTYELKANNSVSFRIQMTAPMPEDGKSIYTYNNASFSSTPVSQPDTRSTVVGNSVRVSMSEPGTLEIVKRTSGTVPSSLQDERFEFRIYEEYLSGGQTEQKNLAYTSYRLYKQNKDGEWEEQTTQAHATDGNGYFYLHADEKAVFELVDAENLKVKETENVFWETSQKEDTADGIRILTVTNTYRPVLYAQKSLSSVPAGVDVTDEIFTFRIRTMGSDGNYHPLADTEYWVVNSVRLDGGIPVKLDAGKTDAEGQFSIRAGQIIALFPGVAGTRYELSEVIPGGETRWNWYCENNILTGRLPSGGDSRTITNYYRWKDLLLTKEITHQTQEEYDAMGQEFTFRLMEIQLDESGNPVTDPEGNPVGKTKEDGALTTAGLIWTLLDENGNEISWNADEDAELPEEETDKAEDSGSKVSGTLDADGCFTCVLGYRTVKIRGLEAGAVYLLQEVTDGIGKDSVTSKPLYAPNNDTLEVTMPIYSSKKDVKFTNDYQMRPLSVTKTVAGADAEMSDTEEAVYYHFTVMITRTMADGTTKQIRPEQGTEYLVTKPGAEDQIRFFGENGTFELADGETAVFKDIGMLGDQFVVTETDNKDQIYPVDGKPFEGTLSGDGGEASFINGTSGSLLIGKIYIGQDEKAEELVEKWRKLAAFEEDWYLPDRKVELVLKVTVNGSPYEEEIRAVRIDPLMPERQENFTFYAGDAVEVYPWETILIPTGQGGIPEHAVYTLEEVEKERLVEYIEYPEGRLTESENAGETSWWMQISQSAASDALAVAKPVTERPVATICNEIRTLPDFDGSKIEKWMTPVSDEVPVGAELVWRVEQYDASHDQWIPAAGIEYAVFTAGGIPVSGQIQTTGTDGKLSLFKTEDSWPAVWFQNDKVYVNLYKTEDIQELQEAGKPLLRVVEVPEESDEAWGRLAGYTYRMDSDSDGRDDDMAGEMRPLSLMAFAASQPDPGSSAGTEGFLHTIGNASDLISGYGLSTGEGSVGIPGDIITAVGQGPDFYSLDVDPREGAGFMNSNVSDTLEIEKKMSEASETRFTMILKQVLSTSDIPVENEQSITATTPGAGIPYTLFKADGTAESGVTGPGGEIGLYAGEHVTLKVPEDTMWTVSEQTFAVPNYRLVGLEPDPGNDRMTKLNDNLMLIHVPASKKYMLNFDDNGGSGGPGTLAQTWKETQAPEQVSFTIPDTVPVKEGCKFLGWKAAGNLTDHIYHPGDVFEMGNWVNKTLVAQWEEMISVTYRDGGKTLYTQYVDQDAGQVTLWTGQPEPKEGFLFKGWSTTEGTETAEYKSGAAISVPERSLTLYAVWKRPGKYDIGYTDGVKGEVVFDDQVSSDRVEGTQTPAFVGTPVRSGYVFLGWSPQINPVVDGDDADESGTVWYTACWGKTFVRTYYTGGTKAGSVSMSSSNVYDPELGMQYKSEWNVYKIDGTPHKFVLASVTFDGIPAAFEIKGDRIVLQELPKGTCETVELRYEYADGIAAAAWSETE